MRNLRGRSAARLWLCALAGCGDALTTPDVDATVDVAATVAGLDQEIRLGCDVIPGEGSPPSLDRCMSYYPESVNRVEFVSDAPADGYLEWRLEIPAGETLRVLRGCHKFSESCTLGVSPRCDGEPRIYRANLRYRGQSRTVTATVPRAACSAPPPPAAPAPVIDPECATAPRGALCKFPPGAPEANQCDGIGQCIDCIDNGGCDESSICYDSRCVPDTSTNLPPLPPAPPPPQPLPPRPQPPSPVDPNTQCIAKPRGTLCNFTGVEPEADQCDGNGVCVDCVTNGGCDESSACDAAEQVCFSILTPPTPPPTPTPPGPAPGTPMATWRAFTTALDAGDQAAALNMLASGSRPIYQQALGTLGGVSRQLTRNWSAPEQLRSGPEFVTFVIVAQERAGARAHLVTLVQENGQWLIEQF